ncbi:MAG TPA: PHB depolymerase family esterase [Gemmataceae bacterium]|nr:PHB depolymerase family esterase [Gemmataceae bacterium]
MAGAFEEPGSHQLRLQWAGLDRHALLYVPAGMSTDAWPVVLMLHGAGGTSPWMLLETRWNEEAEREKFVVVLPDATLPQPDMPLQFFKNPRVWNDGSGLPPASWVQADDVGFLRALLNELPKHLPVDRARIYVTGFSNGASMAFRIGLELSEHIAAIAPVAGYCWQRGPNPKRTVPALYLVGDKDPLVPLDGGTVETPWGKRVNKPPVRDTLARWATLSRGPSDPPDVKLENLYTVARFGPMLEARIIAGLGHHWPGGYGGLSERIAGPYLARVNATKTIWEFFREKNLNS